MMRKRPFHPPPRPTMGKIKLGPGFGGGGTLAAQANANANGNGNRTTTRLSNNNPLVVAWKIISRGLMIVIIMYVGRAIWKNSQSQSQSSLPPPPITTASAIIASTSTTGGGTRGGSSYNNNNNRMGLDTCNFRTYPPKRFYGLLSSPTNRTTTTTTSSLSLLSSSKYSHWPDFLQQTEYMYGEAPHLLKLSTTSTTSTTPKQSQHQHQHIKLCVNQSEWYHPPQEDSTRLPFADGTNPSIVSIDRLKKAAATTTTGTHDYHNWLVQLPKEVKFISTICMTNSQCSWKETMSEQSQYLISTRTEPVTVRTILLLLNEQFETIMETTIYLQVDSKWGRRKFKKQPPKEQQQQQQYPSRIVALDDARLFVHPDTGQLWVSYREGKSFGYDKQVLNPLHIQLQLQVMNDNNNDNNDSNKNMFQVTMKASESTTICCGRNMALLSNVDTNELQMVSWVDPLTVELVTTTTTTTKSVDTIPSPKNDQHQRRQLLSGTSDTTMTRKSHIHGTNGFMIYLPKTKEYLGIGHFHRPNDRNPNDYARFGHHYTHIWFTIRSSSSVNEKDMKDTNTNNEFYLSRVSAEFILPSPQNPKDGEIIQFLSGLELVEAEKDENEEDNDKLLIAYGINDCEGAIVQVDLSYINSLLRIVPSGQQVIHVMEPLK